MWRYKENSCKFLKKRCGKNEMAQSCCSAGNVSTLPTQCFSKVKKKKNIALSDKQNV